MAYRHAKVRRRLKYRHAVALVPAEETGVYCWDMYLHNGELIPVGRSGLMTEAEAISHCLACYGIRPDDWVFEQDDPIWLGQVNTAIDVAVDRLSAANKPDTTEFRRSGSRLSPSLGNSRQASD